ncbi:MAG: hypothetical protein K2K11_01705 [Bacteroidales bacterium]|nr:hypothetical protein [Bacteroidales bacterium]
MFYGDSAVLRLCAGNEVRIAMATSGGEGTLSYTWTADGGGVSVYESGFALEEWPYVTQDSVLVLFFPDSGTHLLNCHISDGAGAALDVKVYVGYHAPEPLYIETLPKTTSARYYEGQAVCFQARPQRYADYHWFRVGGREGSAEITDRQVTQGALYPASFKLERPEEQHQVWVSVIDRNGCRIWDSTGVALMKMPNVMVLDDPNRPLDGVIFPEFEVEITNAWGLCIKGFSDRNGNGSSRGWDGRTPSGTKVTAGTYYYKVKIPTLDGFVYMPGAVTVVNR